MVLYLFETEFAFALFIEIPKSVTHHFEWVNVFETFLNVYI